MMAIDSMLCNNFYTNPKNKQKKLKIYNAIIKWKTASKN